MLKKIFSLCKMIFNGIILITLPILPWALLIVLAGITYALINEVAAYIVIGIGTVFMHVILPFIKS